MATDVEKIMSDYLAARNAHDLEKVVTFFADDAAYEDMATGKISRGKNEIKGFLNTIFLDFPDIKVETKSGFSRGEQVVREWVMSGTFTKSSTPGVEATGKSFSLRGASVSEFRGGKISRITDYWNMVALLQQVGLMPSQ